MKVGRLVPVSRPHYSFCPSCRLPLRCGEMRCSCGWSAAKDAADQRKTLAGVERRVTELEELVKALIEEKA